MKFLGIYIDSHLNWNSQIQHVECKISIFWGILNRIKYKINMKVKLISLPYITYCCSIWGSNYISRLNRLSVLQKRIVRIIGNKPYNCLHVIV